MAFKEFTLNDLKVVIYKRKAARSLRLSLRPDGKVRVTIPAWTPYYAGLEFARSREDWIRQQLPDANDIIQGQAIGKAHHILFSPKSEVKSPRTRILETSIVVSYPAGMSQNDQAVQAAALLAAKRALKSQAEALLPQRLKMLALERGFEYSDVSVRELKSRWGSCDHRKRIVLNYYLMQLPWDYIDYVLIHELVHTRHMNHGSDFWNEMKNQIPSYETYKKEMRKHKPVVNSISKL